MDEIPRPWLASYDPEVRPDIKVEPAPVFDLLKTSAERWPSRTAVRFRNFRIGYARLAALCETVAANLRSRGLVPGDRVGIMLPNLPQTIAAYFGVLRAGGVVVMTNPLYMETELVHQFGDAGVRFLVLLDRLWPKIAALRSKIPVETFFVTGVDEALCFPLNWLYRLKARREGSAVRVPFDGAAVLPWKALLAKAAPPPDPRTPPETTAMLQYTGGTTGVPKACVLTHANLTANVQQCHAMLHALGRRAETFLGILPYFHIYGLTVCVNLAARVGATMIPMPRYVPKEALEAIHKTRPTVFPGAPALYVSLLQQKNVARYNLSSIRYCISGSAPMPVERMLEFERITGARIIEGYGLTEASPVTHINPLARKRKPGTIGLPLPGTEAKIVDMELGGEALGPGKVGELAVRGPQVMAGYHNRPCDTADVLRNGWLYTGDIASMDEEGYFLIVDRKKDLIISAGYNIYPREIDEVLFRHPKIKEAVAVGLPHPSRGQVIKAYVVPKEGQRLTQAEVVTWCRERLAHFKAPRLVEFRSELPKTLVGKVLRRVLLEEEIARAGQKSRTPPEAAGHKTPEP